MIKQAAVFVSGTTISSITDAPKDLVPAADRGLRLNGELILHMLSHDPTVQTVTEMTDSEWSAYLNGLFPGQTWRRWFGRKGSVIYSVVVVED